ncbi:MAG: hypothetical protein IJY31_00385 [Muribaculaceae bacterium]|nr:hypothetical protein [Muribaculaceae bacterium]
MITKKVIDELYRKYSKRPSCTDDLDIGVLFDNVADDHGIEIDEKSLVINSVDAGSLFHKIELERIHAIVKFEEAVAIVLRASILFLNIGNNGVNVHVKVNPPTLWQKILWWFRRN